jgi:hypothetical protein
MHRRKYTYGPCALCSTCGRRFLVSELRYVARFQRWQCREDDDSDTPPDGWKIPHHPFEATRTTAAPPVDDDPAF